MSNLGRISDADIATVRDRVRIDDVVRDYVSLKPAGGGAYKGLCPFHDEKSPSFHVTPSRGMYYCFGCQEGGDAISFLRAMHPELTFVEAVERLAERAGVPITRVEGSVSSGKATKERARLLAANQIAAEFFSRQYHSDEASPARQFLAERGFSDTDAAKFGLGYAPRGWDHLTKYLLGQGVTKEDLLLAGLSTEGGKGVYDKFRGRLIWPIRDISGSVLGFGARKIFDDDEGPKYLNTAETPLYKKSQVLYGIDLAKRSISREKTVVVVEGYTDVMACHLAGVETAVAACGTAFGDGHIRILRRLIADDNAIGGKVIFTFDGDAAGQKAALKAFDSDEKFLAQTYVAVAPEGMDPCELRQKGGDVALKDLINSSAPLFEFVLKTTLERHNLEVAEGRVAALRETAPILAHIKDSSLRPEYVRRLASWIGMDIDTVARATQSAMKAGKRDYTSAPALSTERNLETETETVEPVEWEALKCAIQAPSLAATWYQSVESDCYTNVNLQTIHKAIESAGGPGNISGAAAWVDEVLSHCESDKAKNMVRALSVEPLRVTEDVTEEYVNSALGRLLEIAAERRIKDLKGQIQRLMASGGDATELVENMMALEMYRRDIRERVSGDHTAGSG